MCLEYIFRNCTGAPKWGQKGVKSYRSRSYMNEVGDDEDDTKCREVDTSFHLLPEIERDDEDDEYKTRLINQHKDLPADAFDSLEDMIHAAENHHHLKHIRI